MSKNSKLQDRLLLQKASTNPTKKSIWLHGASVGEIISAYALIKKLYAQADYNIIITSHTATSKHIIKTQFPKWVQHYYLPYDCPVLIKKFIQTHHIKLVLWLEQELFIATLTTIKQSKIPLFLLNARMSSKSFKRWSWLPSLLAYILNNFTFIYPMSLLHAEYFNKFCPKVQFLGNLKYTNNSFKLDNLLIEKLKKSFVGKQLFVALSTHLDEEIQIAGIHSKLQINHPNLITLIIPRHPNRCPTLYQEIQAKYSIQMYTKTTTATSANLYLVDSIGEAKEFCSLALITFIGKSLSLKHQGGHNPLEPIFLNSCTIFGQYMQNFTEITSDLLKQKASLQVSSYLDLENILNHLLDNQAEITTILENSKNLTQSSDIILKKYLNKIICYL